MKQDIRLHRKAPLKMRLSMRSHCPYISGQTEQRIATDVSLAPHTHDQLARAGFRRVENWAYRPACPTCSACVPWRVDTTGFSPSRNMARVLKTNVDLRREIAGTEVTEEHYALFSRYVGERHEDGQMAMMQRDDFVNMIVNSPIDTVLVNYYSPDKKLVASALTDLQSDGLSAVYSFFEPAFYQRSLGTYIILDLIKLAQESALNWLYLGYYVKASQKMAYKGRFQPAEIFINGFWTQYKPEGQNL